MGERGPQPMPTEQKQLLGVRKDRINYATPMPAEGWPAPPPDIAEDALAVWVQLKEDMQGTRHIKHPDRVVLLNFCELVARQRQLSAMVRKMGPVIEVRANCPRSCPRCDEGSCDGTYIQTYRSNPLVVQLRDVTNQIRAFARELGATPSARSNIIDPGKPPTKDSSQDFLS